MTIHARSIDRLASQRVDGEAELGVALVAGRSRLQRLHQRGAAKIRFPGLPGGALEAVLINTAGGLTGGDRIAWSIGLETGASAVVTTQASEKVYRAASGEARSEVHLRLGPSADLAWLPQETIMFDRAAFARRLDADLAPGARLLAAETTVFGRTAMGETVHAGFFRDRWRVKVDGRLAHAEEFAAGPEVAGTLSAVPALGGAVAMSTILLVAPGAEDLLEPARAAIGDAGGASAWTVGGTGKLLARLHAADGYTLRKRLMPLLALLNRGAALPKAWSL